MRKVVLIGHLERKHQAGERRTKYRSHARARAADQHQPAAARLQAKPLKLSP